MSRLLDAREKNRKHFKWHRRRGVYRFCERVRFKIDKINKYTLDDCKIAVFS